MVAPTPRSLPEVIAYLQDSPQPVFYVSRTAANLLGVERYLSGFSYILLEDSWAGGHPRVFTPPDIPRVKPHDPAAVVNWLLRNPRVRDHIAAQTPAGFQPHIVAAFFNEQTERLCEEFGYRLIMPSLALRNRLDSKIVTTQLGNDVGVASAPNILTRLTGWQDLVQQAHAAELGDHLVLQTAYGDAGRTTYFVRDDADYARIAASVEGVDVKVMRYIPHYPLAIEAVVTRHGTVLGPCLREITGHPELTSFAGGWSGSELYPSLLTPEQRARIMDATRRFCDRLALEGYRGILEVSILLDTDTGDVYLGELNPRISGSSEHSNIVTSEAVLPLFAFHILEFAGIDYDLDVDAINRLRIEQPSDQVWANMNVQHMSQSRGIITDAPRAGRYRVEDDGALTFVAPDLDWHDLSTDHEVFYLPLLTAGDYRVKGSLLGLVFTRRRLQEDEYALTPEAKRLIERVQSMHTATPVSKLQHYWRALVRRLRERPLR